MNKDIQIKLIECHILMTEAIKAYGDKELQCKRIFQIKEYRNTLSEDIYKKIEKFVDDVICPLVYDEDYFSFLKQEQYGKYNDKGHFVVDSDHSLEMILFRKYFHIQELLEKLNTFVFEEFHLDYNC